MAIESEMINAPILSAPQLSMNSSSSLLGRFVCLLSFSLLKDPTLLTVNVLFRILFDLAIPFAYR